MSFMMLLVQIGLQHCLAFVSGCDTTGHMFGKGKLTCFKAFMNANDTIIKALAELGDGSKPSQSVLHGCESFICQLFNSNFTASKELRWYVFCNLNVKQDVDKLPPTQGAIIEHINRAHLQANSWMQDIVAHPTILIQPHVDGFREMLKHILPPCHKWHQLLQL